MASTEAMLRALRACDAYFGACARAWIVSGGKPDEDAIPIIAAAHLDVLCQRAAKLTIAALAEVAIPANTQALPTDAPVNLRKCVMCSREFRPAIQTNKVCPICIEEMETAP